MTATPDLVGIDSALLAVVRVTAAGLAGEYGFNGIDFEDIRQELLLDCLFRLRKFDPARSSRRSFLHRVVGHRVATLVSAQRAACRDYRLCRDSLDAPIPVSADDSIKLGETVSGDAYDAGMGRSVRSSCERSELRIDVDNVISRLPAELAAVAVLLKSESVVEVARRLGVSRATTYRRLAQIRDVFAAAGLDAYLGQFQRRCSARSAAGFEEREAAIYCKTGRFRLSRAVGLQYRRRLGINATSAQRSIQAGKHDEAMGGDLAGSEGRALWHTAITPGQRKAQRNALEGRNA